MPSEQTAPDSSDPKAKTAPSGAGPTGMPASIPTTAGNEAYHQSSLGRLDARLFSSPVARRILMGLLLAVLLVPSIQLAVKISKTTTSAWRDQRSRSALGRWMPDAAALADGGNPYQPNHWFPTLPLNLIVLVPLTYVPPWLAALMWSAAKITLVVVALRLLARTVGPGDGAVPMGVLLMAFLFSFRPVISDLQHGNLNLFLLAELGFFWWFFVRGRDFKAGLVLALAITTKLTPALILVYLVYKRAWRAAAGTAIGLALFVVVVPGLLLGLERNFALLGSWFDMMVSPHLLDGYVSLDIANQSLPGVLLRWGRDAGLASIDYAPMDIALLTGMEEMARAGSAGGRWLIRLVSLGLVVVLAWLCRAPIKASRDGESAGARSEAGRRDPRLLLEFALVLLAMLLISERTWKHHAVTLVLIYLGLWRVLACEVWSRRFAVVFGVGLLGQWLALMGGGEAVVGDDFADRLLNSGIFCMGLLLCFVQVAVLLRRMPARSPPAACLTTAEVSHEPHR